MANRHSDKYIDLTANGRLFPSWVMANFKKYKLPEVFVQDDTDPCARATKTQIRLYQDFVSKYLDYRSPFKDMLLMHGLGSGKTYSTINIYNMLYNYTPAWNVFILLKAALKDKPWMVDLDKFLQKEDKDYRMNNIKFISYDAPNADKSFMEAVKMADTTKKNLYIIEEAHNFIRNVYSNITSKQGRRAQSIYDYIIQDKKENEGVRVILLSATPVINMPFELALLFNLLRPGSFPKSESDFNQLYVTSNKYPTINPAYKNMFQRRIMGLVSYYIGSTPDLYASKTIHYVDVPMSKYHEDIYNYYEEIEEKMAMKAREGKGGGTTYKSYTRQACNFVFPALGQNITGETRPRPNKFRISEREAEQVLEGKDRLKLEKGSELFLNVQKYMKAMQEFTDSFDEHLAEQASKDIKNKYTLEDDYNVYMTKYNNNFAKFLDYVNEKDAKVSNLFMAMYKSSSKITNIIFNIKRSMGPTLLYTNYVHMEGIEIIKIYLKHAGFSSYVSRDKGTNDYRYAEFHGDIDKPTRRANIDAYNDPDNKHGKIIKLMMISPAGTEGISLRNVRQVHITEPYWNEVRIVQMIGRALRACYHVDLPKPERHVDVYRYRSSRTTKNKQTTDQYIEDLARSKQNLLDSFLDTLKQSAIDCQLFKNHNMMAEEYQCFQFDEPSLFDEQVGPAYKEDVYDDMRIDNGTNSLKSDIVKIKVKKIKAVKQLTKEDETGSVKYSKPENYWYNSNTLIVYDFEMHYPIGKVGIDDDNIPKKVDDETYIIDQVVPIPMIDSN